MDCVPKMEEDENDKIYDDDNEYEDQRKSEDKYSSVNSKSY